MLAEAFGYHDARGTMRTTRRAFLTSVPAVLLVPGPTARAQTARMHRIGYLLNARPDLGGPLDQAFLEGLRSLGYVAGRNMTLDWTACGAAPGRHA